MEVIRQKCCQLDIDPEKEHQEVSPSILHVRDALRYSCGQYRCIGEAITDLFRQKLNEADERLLRQVSHRHKKVHEGYRAAVAVLRILERNYPTG